MTLQGLAGAEGDGYLRSLRAALKTTAWRRQRKLLVYAGDISMVFCGRCRGRCTSSKEKARLLRFSASAARYVADQMVVIAFFVGLLAEIVQRDRERMEKACALGWLRTCCGTDLRGLCPPCQHQ